MSVAPICRLTPGQAFMHEDLEHFDSTMRYRNVVVVGMDQDHSNSVRNAWAGNRSANFLEVAVPLDVACHASTETCVHICELFRNQVLLGDLEMADWVRASTESSILCTANGVERDLVLSLRPRERSIP